MSPDALCTGALCWVSLLWWHAVLCCVCQQQGYIHACDPNWTVQPPCLGSLVRVLTYDLKS
jgi:hypothetical protein